MSINKIFSLWKIFSRYPFGKWIFSYLIRFVNPYTGRLGAKVEHFEKGHVEVVLQDKKKNRNHLNSVHAIALTNLGEFTSGIAVLGSLPSNIRGIVTHISIDFIKKARGTLKAVCRCEIPVINKDTDFLIQAEIYDKEKDLVARIQVNWKLEPYE